MRWKDSQMKNSPQLRMLQASYEKSPRFYPYVLIYPYTDRIPILSLIHNIIKTSETLTRSLSEEVALLRAIS